MNDQNTKGVVFVKKTKVIAQWSFGEERTEFEALQLAEDFVNRRKDMKQLTIKSYLTGEPE